ncbi:MAG: domain containing protein [Bacteroidetes bacterium]|nr:domain containing protein [Bacteroidota bacterium]
MFLGLLGIVALLFIKRGFNPNPEYTVGQKIDSLNGVYIYYNGGVGNIEERNTSPDGYNIGLKYQCVEFVKRYYYEFYKHKMPDSYGNAKDFFDPSLKDGRINKARNLFQFTNPSDSFPRVGDLIIMDGHPGNPYGHVAIISRVEEKGIEIIQQNPGPFAPSRVTIPLICIDCSTTIIDEKRGLTTFKGKYRIALDRVLGWLRKQDQADRI